MRRARLVTGPTRIVASILAAVAMIMIQLGVVGVSPASAATIAEIPAGKFRDCVAANLTAAEEANLSSYTGSLYCRDLGIDSLAGAQLLTGMTGLDVSQSVIDGKPFGTISDLSPLANLTNLASVNLGGQAVTNFSPLPASTSEITGDRQLATNLETLTAGATSAQRFLTDTGGLYQSFLSLSKDEAVGGNGTPPIDQYIPQSWYPPTDAYQGYDVHSWLIPTGQVKVQLAGTYVIQFANTSPGTQWGFAKLVVTPRPPVITTPVDNFVTRDNTPTIGGTSEPGTNVIVTITNDVTGAVYTCKTVSEGTRTAVTEAQATSATWTLDVGTTNCGTGTATTGLASLPDGKYTYSAIQNPGTSPELNSPKSNIQHMLVDTIAPVITLTPTTAGAGSTATLGTITDADTAAKPSSMLDLSTLTVSGLPAGATAKCAETDPTATCTLQVVMNGSVVQGTYNLAVNIKDKAGNAAVAQSATLTVTPPKPALSLTKDNDNSGYEVGKVAKYNFTITNNGLADATTFTIKDQLPTNFDFQPTTGCTAAGQLITCTITLPAGTVIGKSGGTYNFSINVKPNAPGTKIVNKAAVGTDGGITTATPSGCTTSGKDDGCALSPEATISNGVHLTLTKVNPAVLVEGAKATYTLTVKNTGTGDAAAGTVKVLDRLDPNMEFVSASGASCTKSDTLANGYLLDCTLTAGVAAGTSQDFTITVTTKAATGTKVDNHASVDPDGNGSGTPVTPGTCVDSGKADGCAVTPEIPVIGAPVITGPTNNLITNDNTQTITGTGAAGFDLTVTLVDANDNTKTYTCKTVVKADGSWTCDTSALPDGKYTYSATQSPAGDATTVSPKSNTQTLTVDTVNPAITLTKDSALPGTTITLGSVSDPAFSSDIDPATLKITGLPDGATIECVPAVPADPTKCTIKVTLPAGATPGSYPLDISIKDKAGNEGTKTAAPFTVIGAPVITGPTDKLVTNDNTQTITGTGTPGFDLTVTLTPAGGGAAVECKTVVESDGSWTCDTSALPDGNYTYSATQSPAGDSTTVSPKSNTQTMTVDTTKPVVTLTPEKSPAGTTIKIGSVNDPNFSAGLKLDSLDITGLPAGATWECLATSTVPDAPITDCDVYVTLPAGAEAKDYSITVTITDNAGNTGSATQTFTVAAPKLSLTKDGPTEMFVGTNYDYTLTVTNDGTWDAASTTVSDLLPDGVTYVSNSLGSKCTVAGQVVTCTIDGPIAPGAANAKSFTIKVTPKQSAIATTATNYAAVDVDGPGGTGISTPDACKSATPPEGCASSPDATIKGVALTMTKTNPGSLTVNTAANYTFVITNAGNIDMASTVVKFTDHLDPYVKYNGVGGGASCTPRDTSDAALAAGIILDCSYTVALQAGQSSAAFTINVTPTKASNGAAGRVDNHAAVAVDGTGTPVDPDTCTVSSPAKTGCAVTPDIPVNNGILLKLDKDGPTTMTVGTKATYSFKVSNVGTGAAANATVTDLLPAGLTYDSSAYGTPAASICSAVGQLVTCTVPGPIDPNTTAVDNSKTFTITVNVTAAVASTVTNYAGVDPTGGTNPPTDTTCRTAPTTPGCDSAPPATVDPGINLSLEKISPVGGMTVGVESTYTFKVFNNGTGEAPTATVVDVLPSNLTFVSSPDASCSDDGTKVTCTVAGPIPAKVGTTPGEKTFTMQVMPIKAGTNVINKARVATDGGVGPVDPTLCQANNDPAGCALSDGSTIANGVDLRLSKTGPSKTIVVGETFQYELTVTNVGTGPAAQASVVDLLPTGLEYQGATGAACDKDLTNAQLVTCIVPGEIQPAGKAGNTATFKITVKATEGAVGGVGDTFVNKAVVGTDGGTPTLDPDKCTKDSDPKTGCATSPPTTVVAAPYVDLIVRITPPATLTVGQQSAYDVKVTNIGTKDSDNGGTVEITIPQGLQFDGLPSGTAGVTCTPASGDGSAALKVVCTITAPIKAADPNSTADEFPFQLLVTPLPELGGNSVTVKGAVDTDGGPAPVSPSSCDANGTPTTGCAVAGPTPVGNGVNLALKKDGPTAMTVGVPATYTFTVTNNGTGPATNATVRDLLPIGLHLTGAAPATCAIKAGTTLTGEQVTCTLPGEILPGVANAKTFTMTVMPEANAAGTKAINYAAVDPTGGTNPVDPGSCTADAKPSPGCAVSPEAPVANGVDLGLIKTGPGSLKIGEVGTFTLTVQNAGTGPAASATVKDLLPVGMTYVPNSAQGATCTAAAPDAAGQLVTCTVAGPIAAKVGTTPGQKAFTIQATVNNDVAVDSKLVNKAAVDTTGGGNPGDPAACTATGTPTGCAVSPPVTIVNKDYVDLVVDIKPPTGNTMTVGVESVYDVTVTNNGTIISTTGSTIEIQLPPGLDYKGVVQDPNGTPVTCEIKSGDTTTGITLTCKTSDPIFPAGTDHFQVKVEPLPDLGDKSVSVPAAVDTDGGNTPVGASGCKGQGTPSSGCDLAGPTPVANGIDLSLAKENPATIVFGTDFEYKLVVTNKGPGLAKTATVKDLLPAGLTFVSSTPADICQPDAQNAQLLTCTTGPVAAKGGTASFTIKVKADASLKGTKVVNQAAVDTDGGTGPVDPGTCKATDDPAGCAVTPEKEVTFIDLIVDIKEPTKLVVGENSTYNVTVTNQGTAPSPDGGTVVIELPKGIDYVGVTPGGPLADDACTATGTPATGITVTCTVPGPIGPDGGKVEFGIDVTPIPTSAGEIVKVPAAVDPTGGTTPADPSDCVAVAGYPKSCDESGPVTVANGVDLSLTKQAPPTIVVGETGVYTLTITNNGTGPALNGATVTDLLPAGMEYVSSSNDVCGKAPQGQTLTCQVPGEIKAKKDAPANTASFTITVKALASGAGTSVKNLAAVDTDGGDTPVNPGTCTDTPQPAGCAVSDPTKITYIDLVVDIKEPATLTVGATSSYDVTVTNIGTKESPTGGTVVVEIPKGIDYVGVTPGGPAGVKCDATGTAATGITVTCTVPGPIAADGGNVKFGIDVTPLPTSAGETVKVPAAVDPTGGSTPADPSTCVAQVGHPASCDESGPVTIGNGVNLTLTKTNPARLAVDTVSTYTLTVTNIGTGPANSATVVDQLDPKIEYVSAKGADCKVAGTVAAGQRVTCTVPGPIAAKGGTATFTIDVKPQLGAAPADNRAAVDTDGGTDPVDPNICIATAGGCAVTPEIPVAFVDLIVDIKEPATLTVGETSSYNVTVTNVGTKESPTGGTVVVEIPKGIDYVGVTPGGPAGLDCKATGTSATGITVTCTVPGPIAAGGGKVEFGLDVKPIPAAAGETVKVPAAVDPTGGTTPADPSTCVAQAGHPKSCDESGPVKVGDGVKLSLVKTNPASLEIDKTSSYSFVVTNNGTGPAKSATIADHLPAYVEYVSASGAACTATGLVVDGQRVTCTVTGPIAAGAKVEFTMAVKPTWQSGGTSVRNLAAVDVTGGAAPGNPDLCPLPMPRAAARVMARAAIDPGCAVTAPLAIAKGSAAMTVDKKVGKTSYTVGDSIEYTITFGNTGTAPATAELHDPMPDTVKTGSVTCKTSAGGACKGWIQKNEVYGSVTVNPGETVTFTVTGKVVSAGSVKNVVVVTPTGPECPLTGCKPQSTGSAAAAAKPGKPATMVGKPPKGGFLPSTGATAAWWSVPAGLGLLLVGGLAVAGGRRRKHSS